MMEHECKRSKGVTTTWVDDSWECINAIDTGIAGINFCPYCGVKLEKPEPPKAEFYAEDAEAFKEVCDALEKWCVGFGRMIAARFTGEPAPPDTIEVSREKPEPPKPEFDDEMYAEYVKFVDKLNESVRVTMAWFKQRKQRAAEKKPTRIHRAYWQCLGCGALNTYETDASQSQCLTCRQPRRGSAGVKYHNVKMGDFGYQIAIPYTDD